MKICLVHNQYGKFSGEESVVQGQAELLEFKGHSVSCFTRSSAEISGDFLGQVKAFFSGIYNPASVRQFKDFLSEEKPDLVHIHNLYPLISPAILNVCRDYQLPVVMTVHNYRLVCPNGLFMVNANVCESCSGGKEYWCVLKNCENSIFKSIGYALRNTVARVRRLYLDNVAVFAVLSEFQRQKLIQEGFLAERITVVPNMSNPPEIIENDLGEHIGYVGRISPEKGVETLVDAARICNDIPFQAAGRYEKMLSLVENAPNNLNFLGHLNQSEVSIFLNHSQVYVMCSTCYEGFPAALVEAMLHGRPVIASGHGGIPEVVEDGKTGLLFEPGNAEDLAQKIRYLWEHPELCREMGEAGREKALREYSPEIYYKRLMAVYEKAIYHANAN